MIDLILEARSRIQVVTFTMSEDNVKKEMRQPWVSFGSDASSMTNEGVFIESSTHPRAYGTFARLLGKYVREEKVISLREAIRRLSGLPATNLGLDRRGFLRKDFFADVVVFDPKAIADKATYENPHQYAIGMKHVLVNGVQVLKDGEPTGAKPGRACGDREKSMSMELKQTLTVLSARPPSWFRLSWNRVFRHTTARPAQAVGFADVNTGNARDAWRHSRGTRAGR
jgi:N-acyl-D-aspartate/D-glutamate deacylase